MLHPQVPLWTAWLGPYLIHILTVDAKLPKGLLALHGLCTCEAERESELFSMCLSVTASALGLAGALLSYLPKSTTACEGEIAMWRNTSQQTETWV